MQLNFFLCLIFPILANLSICVVSTYQWDEDTPMANVRTFATFMDALYKDYNENNDDKMDTFLQYSNTYPKIYYSMDQKRTVFNLTFIKCAAEIAHFRVNKENTDEVYRNWNVDPNYVEDIFCFLHYDQSLGRQIAEKFQNEIFSPEKQIAQTIVNQIMQLTFSLAIRIQLSVIYAEYFDSYYGDNLMAGWQLKTMLTAYKKMSNKNCNCNGNGIFPFEIIKIDENGTHLWAEYLSPEVQDNEKQQKYIRKNFNFILELSNFKLSYYDVYEFLQVIEKKTTGNKHAEKLHAFLMDKFTLFLRESSLEEEWGLKIGDSQFSKLDCVLIRFGRHITREFSSVFGHLFEENSKRVCGEEVHIEHYSYKQIFGHDNTPKKSSKKFEMELFQEPLWNYARVIEIDVNESESVLKFCKDLRGIVKLAKKKLTDEQIKQLDEYNFLYSLISGMDDDENKIKLKDIGKRGNKFLPILKQIEEEYSSASKCQLRSRRGISLTYFRRSIFQFGRILYETLKEHWGKNEVQYDEQKQMLTFPLEMGKRFIQRLSAFVKSNLKESSRINEKMDFGETVQLVASMDNELNAVKGPKFSWKRINLNLLKLLFTLAIRLCLKIGGNDYETEYLPTFLFARKMCAWKIGGNNYGTEDKSIFAPVMCLTTTRDSNWVFFDYKIQIVVNEIQINMPNWNLPYIVYMENENELNEKGIRNIWNFYLNWRDGKGTVEELIKELHIVK